MQFTRINALEEIFWESEMEVIGREHVIHENEKNLKSLPMVNECNQCMLYWIIITNF